MDWIKQLASGLAEIATAVAIMAWLGKQFVSTLLKAGVETHKANLKRENDREILKAKNRFDKTLAEYKQQLTAAAKSDERIRQEIVAWANPIFSAVRDLQGRLRNILKDDGYKALSAGYSRPDWSITYDYFLPSTVYLFAQYFCWTQMLREELSFELFRTQSEMQAFFAKIEDVSDCLGNFPPHYDGTGNDVQVFRLQQRAIGEIMASRRGGKRACRSYPQFLNKWSAEKAYSDLCSPVVHLIDGVKLGDRRWKRLEATHVALGELARECDRVLKLTVS